VCALDCAAPFTLLAAVSFQAAALLPPAARLDPRGSGLGPLDMPPPPPCGASADSPAAGEHMRQGPAGAEPGRPEQLGPAPGRGGSVPHVPWRPAPAADAPTCWAWAGGAERTGAPPGAGWEDAGRRAACPDLLLAAASGALHRVRVGAAAAPPGGLALELQVRRARPPARLWWLVLCEPARRRQLAVPCGTVQREGHREANAALHSWCRTLEVRACAAPQARVYQAPCAARAVAALPGGGALLGTATADLQLLAAAPGGALAWRASLGPTAPPRAVAVADLAGLAQNQARPRRCQSSGSVLPHERRRDAPSGSQPSFQVGTVVLPARAPAHRARPGRVGVRRPACADV